MRSVPMGMPWAVSARAEAASGVATALFGGASVLVVGASVLGNSVGEWLSVPAVPFVWLPLVSVGVLAAGALHLAPVAAQLRWLAQLALSVSVLLALVVSASAPLLVIPVLLGFVTSALGELRARIGLAPTSLGGLAAAALATLPTLVVLGLTLQWLALLGAGR